MPRKKKPRGRPPIRPLPPRADATPEDLARAFFKSKPGDDSNFPMTYYCVACEEAVHYPKILYRDGRCEDCGKAPVKN